MMLLRVTALLLLAGGLWDCATASAGSEGAVDCCLATSSSRIPLSIVKSFQVQTTDGGCKVDATLIITKKNKKLCAPPASQEKWVQDLIDALKKNTKTKKAPRGCRKGKNQKHRRRNCRQSKP